MATRLFALDGVDVVEVDAEAGGGRTVWVVTADPAAAACPGCGTVSARVREYVTTRPADLRHGQDEVAVRWVKRRLECREPSCPGKTFTESVAQVPPRCRVTARLRGHAAGLVADGGRTVAQAARECGLSWPVVHEAFADRADPVLERPPSLVAHLGIDEHCRGRPRFARDDGSGEYVLLADCWHSCFFDLSGDQGLLGQVEGRTADDAAYWLAQGSPAWRDAVQIVATGMCSIYASAVRRMLPAARLVVDLFHVVQLAVKMTGDVRRWLVREKYGRRGRSGDGLSPLARTISRWEDKIGAVVARLTRLADPAFLAEAGWDPGSRVPSLPSGHLLLGWRACPSPGCGNPLYGRDRECGAFQARRRCRTCHRGGRQVRGRAW